MEERNRLSSLFGKRLSSRTISEPVFTRQQQAEEQSRAGSQTLTHESSATKKKLDPDVESLRSLVSCLISPSGVPIKDRKKGFKKIKSCFVGMYDESK
jgi:hypothetical protein